MRRSGLSLCMAAILTFSLLAGCGQTEDEEEREAQETRKPALLQTEAPITETAEPTASPEPEPESEPMNDIQTAIRLEDIAGLWELYSYEVEGDRLLAEQEGVSGWLRFRADGTVDQISLSSYGDKDEQLAMDVAIGGDGYLCFQYDIGFGVQTFRIIDCDGAELTVSGEWSNPDGTPGGNTTVYRLVEPEGPDFRGRRLTQAELDALNASLGYEENGFFLCAYERPEEIDWHEVCYNGAGIAVTPTEAMRAEYERFNGELFTDLEVIPRSALERFVWEKTQTHYSEARKPLDWYFTDDGALYMYQHGDTNLQSVAFTEGYADGTAYELYYSRSDWRHYIDDRPFVMRADILDGNWVYHSNIPADAPAPIALLDIELSYDSREDARRSTGVTEFVEIEAREDDEPYGWGWAVLTAKTDGVRYIVDRMEHSDEFDVTVPGDNITSGVLDEGESVALYVNQPWHPSIRVTATKGEYWGEYTFGEDNWLHLGDVPRYITGHDLQGEGRGCDPETEEQLANFLEDGTWAYVDEATGEVLAAMRFDGYHQFSLATGEEHYPVFVRYERFYARESDAPDLMNMEPADYYFTDWSALPDWFLYGSLGGYLVSAVQLDGEQVLYLNEAAEGGLLGYLFPGADGNTTTFILHRWRGTTRFEPQG